MDPKPLLVEADTSLQDLSFMLAETDPRHLAEWILEDGLPVRLQLQLHKLLWGETPGH